ncbi:sulfate ABC transporter permease subunit CysT [Butyrivibrio sp. CB08]|uniref:sulfate ABC transporter permease subunit CysT n=1 Tax=Butyrivibrio sp. CB08 TaxID=2364879 RepID=UPI000EA871DB|nr:sulfate ABC transporter permease subunit CysT [Butyrivibrio sp. CB08]RKM57870.1 sulfate ABC transporter permease subunit CysT [Butyrivibrio sp. CB08]
MIKEKNKEQNNKRKKRHGSIPGFGLSMGITLTMLSMLVLIPLASILLYGLSLSPSEFFAIVCSDSVRYALRTSILCSFIAATINCVFGMIIAWTLVRYNFFHRRLIDGLIELPFALPTAVAGITLSKMYSNTGIPGKWLSAIGIDVSYTHLGIVVALIFVGIPFVVRTVQPVLQKFDYQYEEAAHILGAGRIITFIKVMLPELMPALLTGFGLAFARGMGEYGSVIYISGNSAKDHTQVVSYVIMQKLNYMDYAGATAVALVMLITSFVILMVINLIQIKQSKRTNNV